MNNKIEAKHIVFAVLNKIEYDNNYNIEDTYSFETENKKN